MSTSRMQTRLGSLAAVALAIAVSACGSSGGPDQNTANDANAQAPPAPVAAGSSSGSSSQAQRAPAPRPSRTEMQTVPAGTVLVLALDAPISTASAQAGDEFTATVVEAVTSGNDVLIPEGSRIEGKVTEAVPAKRGAGNAKLALGFDALRLPGGYRTEIVGSFQQVSASQKKRNAAIIGGSAAGGAILGRIIGKDTKGAVIGTIVGGGVGTAVVMGKGGTQVQMAADAPFELKLQESVRVPS